MPLWKIYHGHNTLTSEDKQSISKGATEFYVKQGFPSWYVHVLFFQLEPSNFYTGGESKSNTIGAEIIHIARRWDPANKAAGVGLKDSVDRILGPYSMDRGLHLEYAVLEGPAELWRINGIDPPEAFGPNEQEHAERNRKILYERYGS